MKILVIFIVVIAMGGGSVIAAEGALPGDVFHSIKVNINEEVRALFSFSAEAKTGWNIRRAERRLEEAQLLAVEGRMDERRSVQAIRRIRGHTERVKSAAMQFEQEMEDRMAIHAYAQLEAVLSVYAAEFLHSVDNAQFDAEVMDSFVTQINSFAHEVAEERRQAEFRIVGEPQSRVRAAAEESLRSAEREIADAELFIERGRVLVDFRTASEAEGRLRAAKSALASGRSQLDLAGHGGAFIAFQDAYRNAHEAKVVIRRNALLFDP